ncbi:tRNA uridine(34) 5-carboxymethylaminomethyl modification radical SAM/GNAT enzyme Elp3 [Candidatus Pacearchaeota archaeon CG10_big_fil_rev_8_21_14_0_10_30_48]|nr:MAG: tRNA uridine(34) 5-carboxymethylaminomethyl modification radical SAM/GNAT enzyme Elp3 [Candidatus Pacearchaeota archaeon CG10_big_fil_rev_8_21_14_0_10_30_48]
MKLPQIGEVRKPTKTLAGVTPIAVMCAPRPCSHGVCRYCPVFDVPQSYTPASPPVLRAKRHNYESYGQIESRLKAFEIMNHPTDKIEIIILGGTFLDYPIDYQYEFIKGIYDALNKKKSKTLEQAKKLNETAKHRCVALCIETRPDFAGKKEIERALDFGCTRMEIGVQILDDEIYKHINRAHTVQDVIDATKNLRNAGFKIGYHIMPGLPKSNPEKDLKLFKLLWSSPDYKPDQLKIYPTTVMKNTGLERDFKRGKFKPYTLDETQELLVKMFKIIPEYCRTMRVMRQFTPEHIVAGTTRISLRKDIDEDLRARKIELKEIRYREIGHNQNLGKKIDQNIKIKTSEYQASDGKEFFIQVVNADNILFGLLRLRIPDNLENPKIKELKNCSIIRELHVYGQSLNLKEKSKILGQHKGLGKELMKKAEDIARKNKIKRMAVISGIGVREYYKKLGYKLDHWYMIKDL